MITQALATSIVFFEAMLSMFFEAMLSMVWDERPAYAFLGLALNVFQSDALDGTMYFDYFSNLVDFF
jgi:hypothetical protein